MFIRGLSGLSVSIFITGASILSPVSSPSVARRRPFRGRIHGALDRLADPDQLFNGIFSDELAHIIVDAAPGKNDFRVVADLFGLVGEVVWVDADAVPADQAGEKLEFYDV